MKYNSKYLNKNKISLNASLFFVNLLKASIIVSVLGSGPTSPFLLLSQLFENTQVWLLRTLDGDAIFFILLNGTKFEKNVENSTVAGPSL